MTKKIMKTLEPALRTAAAMAVNATAIDAPTWEHRPDDNQGVRENEVHRYNIDVRNVPEHVIHIGV